nr:MAG TPA: hypothetical protein [Caudoviricetes sp.]
MSYLKSNLKKQYRETNNIKFITKKKYLLIIHIIILSSLFVKVSRYF